MEIISNHRLLLFVESLIWLLLGSLAVALPIVMTSFTEKLYLGIVFILLGAYQILRSIEWRKCVQAWVPTIINLIAYWVLGILLLALPQLEFIYQILMVSILFAFDGVTKIVTGTLTRASGWFLYSGIVSFFFMFAIWSAVVSVQDAWILSIFVGVDFLFFGLALWGCLLVSFFRKA